MPSGAHRAHRGVAGASRQQADQGGDRHGLRCAPVQQPVPPVHSALTTPQQTAGPDLNNRNEVALAMAAQIAQMVGDR